MSNDRRERIIGLAQLNPMLGGFNANVRKIEAYFKEAERNQCQLLVTPELALSGYPPQDLLLHPSFLDEQDRATAQIVEMTRGSKTEILLGCVQRTRNNSGKPLQNVAVWIADGNIVHVQPKTLLPAFDVFDEPRFFRPSEKNLAVLRHQRRWGVAICEDIWAVPQHSEHYANSPVSGVGRVDALLVLNASPFARKKLVDRLLVARNAQKATQSPVVYVNQTCAVDNILFDGRSFVLNEKSEICVQLPAFDEGFLAVDLDRLPKALPPQEEDDIELLSQALSFGVREYVLKTKQKGVVIGLSGGIDSAVVACLACRALGPKNVTAVALPGPFSNDMSLEDAQKLSAALGITCHVMDIDMILKAASTVLGKVVKRIEDLVAYENLQSRIRGLLLMGYANANGLIVLNTSNKSELAVGYSTLYGDAIGALSPLGDVLKTDVYALARFINRGKPLIPERILTRAPSAELRPDQTDQDSLPPYEILDKIIYHYIERLEPPRTIASKLNLSEEFVKDWLRKIEGAEFKRRQAPFVLHVSARAFDSGRRVPIMKELS
jgi:NAD+ synthetase